MKPTLSNHEWEYLIQIIIRIMKSSSYEELCDILFHMINVKIPFASGAIYQSSRSSGMVKLEKPMFYKMSEDEALVSKEYIESNYPKFNSAIMSSKTMIYRRSDTIADVEKWMESDVYHSLWKRSNYHYQLVVSLVHNDVPLSVISLFRRTNEQDFSAHDLYVLEVLSQTMEEKFYELLYEKAATPVYSPTSINAEFIKKYHVTKRETEVLAALLNNKSRASICQSLNISSSTLNKHISNMYEKMAVNSIMQIHDLYTTFS